MQSIFNQVHDSSYKMEKKKLQIPNLYVITEQVKTSVQSVIILARLTASRSSAPERRLLTLSCQQGGELGSPTAVRLAKNSYKLPYLGLCRNVYENRFVRLSVCTKTSNRDKPILMKYDTKRIFGIVVYIHHFIFNTTLRKNTPTQSHQNTSLYKKRFPCPCRKSQLIKTS